MALPRLLLSGAIVLATAVPCVLDAQSSARREAGVRVRSEALARERHAVVIDLDANRLYFARGTRVLWSAPVGTGTGLRMESGRGTWDFSTPRGTYQVVYKEREPDWIAPDWYFLENNLPVPGPDHPSRRHVRGLGSAAVFIGRGLAIHGTDKPHLLGQRVSHGCIRLSNEDALRLFHNVQVGTEVVIVGGDRLQPTPPAASRAAPPRTRPAGTPPPRDSVIEALERVRTARLVAGLEEALESDPGAARRPRWTDLASVLLLRGALEGDDESLEGLFSVARRLERGRLRDEFGTFLKDAYVQAPVQTLAVLGRQDRATRQEVAALIAATTVALFPGEAAHPQLPWPTRRVPRESLGGYGRRAWDALAEAEAALRPREGLAAGVP